MQVKRRCRLLVEDVHQRYLAHARGHVELVDVGRRADVALVGKHRVGDATLFLVISSCCCYSWRWWWFVSLLLLWLCVKVERVSWWVGGRAGTDLKTALNAAGSI